MEIIGNNDIEQHNEYPRLGWIIPAIGLAGWGTYDVVSFFMENNAVSPYWFFYVIGVVVMSMLAFTMPSPAPEQEEIAGEEDAFNTLLDEEEVYEVNNANHLAAYGSDPGYARYCGSTPLIMQSMDNDY